VAGSEVQIQAVWVDGMSFVVRGLGSQATFVMDAAPESGGASQGVRPTEALLSAVAGCSGMDVLIVLRKMRQDVTGLTINVSGVRAEDYPRPVETATVEYVVRGHQVSEAAVARAVSLSETKYCGVMASLKAEITTRYRVEAE
jgi:putative redox protein